MKNCLLAILFFFGLVAQTAATSHFDNQNGTIVGKAVDRETGNPIGFVYLHLEELHRPHTAHADGTFEFQHIPAGEYTLSASRIGYQSTSQSVSVTEGDTTVVKLTLKETVLNSDVIEIVGERHNFRGSNLEKTSKTISGESLRQSLGTTLATTLSDIPGLSARSMGAAPARPILRGLGGERLLILQDGERTGDVSSQSADHAVTVDPMSAEKIEIARGPAALQYGSNAIGGVINVVRNQVPLSKPDHIHGTFSFQGQSVNTGGIAGMEASLPLGKNLALKFDGNIRSAGNTTTPIGKLQNSDLFSTNNSIGLSYLQSWGYVGIASNMYLNNYGIPPDSDSGHQDGVNIEVQKYQFEGKAEINFENSFFKSLDTDLSHKNYYHRELESANAIGTEFGVLTTNASVVGDHREWEITDGGQIGIWAEVKDYAVNGTRTPNSNSYSLSGFLIEEKELGPLKLEAGGRLDLVHTIPEADNPNSAIGHIRTRNFTALAGSASAIYDFGSGITGGLTILRSFRAPSQEELYSEGPHLASYSYEVGNPDLNSEHGLGKELFVRYKHSNATSEMTFYHNGFTNYIYPRNTGRQSARFPSLDVYQFSGVEASFKGAEFTSQIEILDHWVLSGSLSYTHAERKLSDHERQQNNSSGKYQPLPMIPPLKIKGGLTYGAGELQLGINTKWSDNQSRTGNFETPTNGYNIWNIFGQYRFQSGKMLHTLSLNAENLFNTVYRDHLSRIKDLMPAPGRNVSLLYRTYF